MPSTAHILGGCPMGRSPEEGVVDEWGEVFGDDVMASALIDRLVHHCHIVNIRGNSYRMRQHSDLWKQLHPVSDGDSASASSPPRRTRRKELQT